MKILFDHSTPRQLRTHLTAHDVATCPMLGWDQLQNGDLISAAEAEGFDLMISCDQNLKYQQNLSKRKIALIVLGSNNKITVLRFYELILDAVALAKPGSYSFIKMPHERKKKTSDSPG